MKYKAVFIFLIGLSSIAFSNVELASLFTDHMVLQRNQPVRIWGKGTPEAPVIIKIAGRTGQTVVDKDSTWAVLLNPFAAGGPYTLTVREENTLTVKDVMIGDVYICGGQSNMEWPVIRTENYEEAVQSAVHNQIRIFTVPRKRAFSVQHDIQPARWKIAAGEQILDFSAVGYYFGRFVHEETGIPLGLISSNWGGTCVESWMSESAMRAFPDYRKDLNAMQSIDMPLEVYEAKHNVMAMKKLSPYYPESDKGMLEQWHKTDYDDNHWQEMTIPTAWENAGLENYDGVVWFRKTFKLTEALKNKRLYLRLGFIYDFDITWINGNKIGETLSQKKWRSYKIPARYLNPEGENVIVIRVFDYGDRGGLDETRADKITLDLVKWQLTEQSLSVAGAWKYKPTLKQTFENIPEIDYDPVVVSPNQYPCLLYNGMIAPMTDFSIRGVIWYQGESNAHSIEDAFFYRTLFSAMIQDWRRQWHWEFPFLFVQLANFRKPAETPVEGKWPYLRESQTEALKLPKTGMAVIIDIGEAEDIHPRNKKDVGRRLGLSAMHYVYDKVLVHSGPIYHTHEKNENGILVKFKHTGSGLVSYDRYGYLNGFAIAGPDSQFVWSKAEIVSDHEVWVYQKGIQNPVAVRYGWADNPSDLCLYNKEGLPASPFRTDHWPAATEAGSDD